MFQFTESRANFDEKYLLNDAGGQTLSKTFMFWKC